jgi:hypothetical protein
MTLEKHLEQIEILKNYFYNKYSKRNRNNDSLLIQLIRASFGMNEREREKYFNDLYQQFLCLKN